MFKVGMYLDEYASLSRTQAEEYEDLQEDLKRELFQEQEHKVTINVPPWKLEGYNFDLYIVDFGGICSSGLGFDTGYKRYTDPLAKAIQDNPSTYFMIWSNFTVSYLKAGFYDLFGLDCWNDTYWPANVIRWPERYDDIAATWKRVRGLLGLPEPPPPDLSKYQARRAEEEESE